MALVLPLVLPIVLVGCVGPFAQRRQGDKSASPPGRRPFVLSPRISYPPIRVGQGAEGRWLDPFVDLTRVDDRPTLKFGLRCGPFTSVWPNPESKEDAGPPELKRAVVRLHKPDGTKEEQQVEASYWTRMRVSGPDRVTLTLSILFDWPKNALDELWVEFWTPDSVYWFEVPYGFARNPLAPLPPAMPAAGAPRLPPGLMKPEKGRWIVPWHIVEYGIDTTPGGQADWELSTRLSNHRDVQCDVVLVRDGMWEFWWPRTSVSVRDAKGKVYGSSWPTIRNELSGMRRIDAYELEGCHSPGREWGTLRISVDKSTYAVTIPSSLYKTGHGHAGDLPANELVTPPSWWDTQGVPWAWTPKPLPQQ